MAHKKYYQIGIFVIGCIIANYVLKYFAVKAGLPFWFDNIGTAFAAYELGPFCGAVVGATLNITYGFRDSTAFLYALVSASVGIVIGVMGRKKKMNSVFRFISIGLVLAFVSTVLSTPINCYFYDGYTSNVWGDGILELLKEWRVHWIFAATISEFFIDFLDKIITVFILGISLCIVRKVNKRLRNRGKTNKIVSLFVVVVMAAGFIPDVAHAQEKEKKEEDYNSYIQFVYDNDNGLLSGEANDIVTTKDGILWVGTYAGLYRYNGVNFKYMNEYSSVKNVNCLYCDEEGRLMIGTNDSGLSIAIKDEIVNVLDEEQGLPSNSVRCIVQQSSGKYFVGTTSELSVVTLSGGISVYDTFPEIIYARSISADENNHIATVTSDGDMFLIEDMDIIAQALSSEDEVYTACTFGENGKLYVGTEDSHMIQYDISTGKLVEEKRCDCKSIGAVNSINFMNPDTIVVCGESGACYYNKVFTGTLLNLGEYSSSIEHAIVDYQGNLWFTSSRLGVMKMCKSPFSELFAEVGLNNEVTNSIAVRKDYIYVGTDSGLEVINKRGMYTVKNELTTMLDGVRVRCVMKDSKENLWISTYGKGVICVNQENNISVFDSECGVPGNRFRFTYELKDGSIAISGDEGVAILKDGAVVSVINSDKGLNNNVVLTIYENEKGELLLGTDGGGIEVVSNGVVTSTITRQDGLISDVILRLVPDKDNNGVFVVTSNSISYIDYQNNGNIKVFDQFPYTNNYDLYDNGDGKIFVTGSAGIYVVDKEELLTGRSVEYELLNSLNGLRGTITVNAWNCVDENNIWYIANSNGVSRLDINQYQEKVRSYRMLLSSYKVDDIVYTYDSMEAITIPSGAGIFEIQPEIINYSTKDPYISYYLEGIDKQPVILHQSELSGIVYANIPAGEYNFYLSVLDDSLSGNIEQQVYRIVKEKEIYENWWFKFFFVIEVFLIVACITWFITRTVVQKTFDVQKKEIELAKEQIKMGNETILAIARTVDAKDSYTSQHSTRVAEYSVLISQKLNYSEEEQENLRKMALLHDIGKIGIPDSVLNKTGNLTDEEYNIMKSHVTVGGEILKDFTLVKDVQDAAMYHHERWDGKGYAKGLKGEEIPEAARIVGIADAFDAMTANRVYRKKLEFPVVIEELKKGKGTQFDARLVDIMLELIEEGKIDMQDKQEE